MRLVIAKWRRAVSLKIRELKVTWAKLKVGPWLVEVWRESGCLSSRLVKRVISMAVVVAANSSY